MKSFNRKDRKEITLRTQSNNQWLPLLAFFACTLIYFGFFAGYVMFYQEKSALFFFSFDFLKENLHQPGGLLIWLGKLVSTFFYYPFAGSFIIASILTLIVYFSGRIISQINGTYSIIIPLIAGVLLFILQTDYLFLIYNSTGILLQILFFWLSIKYQEVLKGWIPLIILPLWYFATGGFAAIGYLMLVIFFATGNFKKEWIKLLLLPLIAFVTFYIYKEFLFFQSEKTLLEFPYNKTNTGTQTKLFFAIVSILIFIPLLSKLKPEELLLKRTKLIHLNIGLPAVILLTLTVCGVWRYDKKTDLYFKAEKLFSQSKYDDLISFNKANPPANSLTIFLNNIALCEQNKLNDQLFSTMQSPDGNTLFLKWEMIGEVLRRGAYFYYTIGMFNEAHRWAFENMVMKGHSPENLKMLIKTELINGNYKVAERYISLLKESLFYKEDALHFEKLLFNDIALNSDPDLGKRRKARIGTDFFSITDDPYVNIGRILITDSLNRNAFEYKIAYLLLRKDYQGLSAELPRFKQMGYNKFPVNVEEAAIALSVLNNGKLPDLGSINISRNTEARWENYLTVFQQYGTNPKTAEPALRKQFGNTFWYWAFYR